MNSILCSILLCLLNLVKCDERFPIVLSSNNHSLSATVGSNLTLHCLTSGEEPKRVLWHWGPDPSNAKEVQYDDRLKFQENGDLVIFGLKKADAKRYLCQDAESNESINTVLLEVKSVPASVSNLSVMPSSVYALVTWSPVLDNGGFPILHFRLSYRLDKSHLSEEEERKFSFATKNPYDWTVLDNIGANSTSHTVYKLSPNSTYYFRICAVNRLGCGSNVSVQSDTTFVEEEVKAARELIELEEDTGAEEPQIKIWALAVTAFVVTFVIIGFGITLLLLKNYGKQRSVLASLETTEEEEMELVPHITLNPSFNIEMLEFESTTNNGEGTTKTSLKNDGGSKIRASLSFSNKSATNKDVDKDFLSRNDQSLSNTNLVNFNGS